MCDHGRGQRINRAGNSREGLSYASQDLGGIKVSMPVLEGGRG